MTKHFEKILFEWWINYNNNSKFQELQTLRTLKTKKNDQIWTKKCLKINDYEKPTKKGWKKRIIIRLSFYFNNPIL